MNDIFVGNLDYETTEDELRHLFGAYGLIVRINIVTDRDSGQPRGFAFIQMNDSKDAERAITELNGTSLHDRKLQVNEARPRPVRSERGWGRRRSGGRW
jgi:cold-inducible RNA-binding protein